MATADRSADEPPLVVDPADLRARLLHACFATPTDRLETTLPPDDPDADLTWGSITFVWRTRTGEQPVIMPLWRRLD